MLGWDVLTPRLVEELNVILRKPITPTFNVTTLQKQWELENKDWNKRRRKTKKGVYDRRFKTGPKRRRNKPIGELSGCTEVLQIDAADFYAFLGVLTEMGLHRLSAVSDYWKTGRKRKRTVNKKKVPGTSETGNGIAKELWTREAWCAISVALCHLSEETIFWMESIFNERAKKHYLPSRGVVIDELGWPYKGHSRHRNYSPKKVVLEKVSEILTTFSLINGTLGSMRWWMNGDSATVSISVVGVQRRTKHPNQSELFQRW